MALNKPSVCLISDNEAFKWIPLLMNEWKIKYLFCYDEKLKACLKETFALSGTEINITNDVFKYLDDINHENFDLLFLALSTNTFHELVLQHILQKKKFSYVFSSNLPTLNIQKLNQFRALLNGANSTSNTTYDSKDEFKNDNNNQIYWNIFNPLLNEQVFYNLKNMLNELGNIYGVQIESTYIPFYTESEELENVLYHRTVLMLSLIELIFDKPQYYMGKCYSVKSENASINCLSGNLNFNSLNCSFNISVNNPNKAFMLKVYGEHGFMVVSYSKKYNCFELQRCLNHYEYPSLFTDNSHQNALNEIKYFLKENLCTKKYINSYIDSIYASLCLWKSEGTNISLENEKNNCTNDNKIKMGNNYIAA